MQRDMRQVLVGLATPSIGRIKKRQKHLIRFNKNCP